MIPKFRAFIKTNIETVYGGLGYSDDCVLPVGLIDFTDGEVTVWGCGREDCGLCGDDFRLDDIILMQSTGLKDKNGAEVYFNDIVEDVYGHRYEVVFEGDCLRCNGIRRIRGGYKPKNRWFNRDLKIIGNIYENSELKEVPE